MYDIEDMTMYDLRSKSKADVLAAVRQNGRALRYVDDRLKDDRDIVQVALKNDGMALQYASDGLRADKKIVLLAVGKDSMALQYASDRLRADKEVVLLAVGKDGMALQYASDGLRADKKVVLAALDEDEVRGEADMWIGGVIRDPCGGFCVKQTLLYASDTLKADEAVVLAALRVDPASLYFAAKTLKANKTFMLQAIKQSGQSFRYVAGTLKDDRAFIFEAIQQNAQSLLYVSKTLKNRDFILQAVKQNGLALEHANDALRADNEVVLAAVKQNGLALAYVAPELREDREIVRLAIQNTYEASKYAPAQWLPWVRAWARVILRCKDRLPNLTPGSAQHALADFFQFYPGLKKLVGDIMLRYANPLVVDDIVDCSTRGEKQRAVLLPSMNSGGTNKKGSVAKVSKVLHTRSQPNFSSTNRSEQSSSLGNHQPNAGAKSLASGSKVGKDSVSSPLKKDSSCSPNSGSKPTYRLRWALLSLNMLMIGLCGVLQATHCLASRWMYHCWMCLASFAVLSFLFDRLYYCGPKVSKRHESLVGQQQLSRSVMAAPGVQRDHNKAVQKSFEQHVSCAPARCG